MAEFDPRVPAGPDNRIDGQVRPKVLILDFDIYGTTGGGQTAYRKIVAKRPDVDFFYFETEDNSQAKPANAKGLPFAAHYLPADTSNIEEKRLVHFYDDYLTVANMAASAQAELGTIRLDVLDAPDYRRFGVFARLAFEHHGFFVGAVTLALHGLVSDAHRENWPGVGYSPRHRAQMKLRERLQFGGADGSYAVSAYYAAQWKRITGLGSHLVDPLIMSGEHDTGSTAVSAESPDLVFVGRLEKFKGPDLFLDMAWFLPPDSYAALRMIGDDFIAEGISGKDYLKEVAQRRGLSVDFSAGVPPEKLFEIYARRTLLVVSSRFDTFNLVALEALQRGCPVLVTGETGFAHWLKQMLPELQDCIIDMECSRSAALKIEAALRNYDQLRKRVSAALDRAALRPNEASLIDIWEPMPPRDIRAKRINKYVFDRLLALAPLQPDPAREAPQDAKSESLAEAQAVPGPAVRPSLISRISSLLPSPFQEPSWEHLRERAANELQPHVAIRHLRYHWSPIPSDTPEARAMKLKVLSENVPQLLTGRVALFREMARLEEASGNDLIAATYRIRVMRWLDADRFADLAWVQTVLRNHGFEKEAAAVVAMYGPKPERASRITALLNAQREEHRSKSVTPLALLDDRRASDYLPKVAVIVSLYNAETKLKTLLDNLALQPLSRAGQVEIILVDSASPSNERAVFEAQVAHHPSQFVYARSALRETIQAAWNRGIGLSRAPYLAFLGADEGLHPDCLGSLASVLDDEPDVDWVMADSICTNVNNRGVFADDIFKYDRGGFHQSLVGLETCYLSWVGALYRRTLHDRFGYYDETFRAAGDTEFKNRILGRIVAKHVAKPLGVFNNYPEARTTQHPRAEIEDLRAWYLHRTVPGVAGWLDEKPLDYAWTMFRFCLGYRKSYQTGLSTDFDLAGNLSNYLLQRTGSEPQAREAARSSKRLLNLVQRVERLNTRTRSSYVDWQLRRILLAARGQETVDARSFNLGSYPEYQIFNDNRYEQHWWSWSQ